MVTLCLSEYCSSRYSRCLFFESLNIFFLIFDFIFKAQSGDTGPTSFELL